MTLNDEIKAFREDTGLSQAALARELGVTVNTISEWERGRMPRSPGLIRTALAMIRLRLKRKEKGL